MDFLQARVAMVDSQLRPNNVRDPRLISQFLKLPRELFVPQEQRALAYADAPLPVEVEKGAARRALLSPMTLGKLLQAVQPTPQDRVLDIGGISGYGAAVLGGVCRSVIALETSETAAHFMENALKAGGIEGVKVVHGALSEGYKAGAPYDIIILNGRVHEPPKQLIEQLAKNGRLAAIVGGKWCGQAMVFTKAGGAVTGQAVFDASAEVLPGFEQAPSFAF